MRNSPLKSILVFIIGSILNILMFCVTKYTPFPFWLDFVGTFYIASVCGIWLGGASAVLHTLLISFAVDGMCDLWLLIPALLVVAVLAICKKTNLLDTWTSYIMSMYLSVTVGTFGCAVVYLINTDLPTRFAQNGDIVVSAEYYGRLTSRLIGCVGVETVTVSICMLIVTLAFILTPRQKNTLTFKK